MKKQFLRILTLGLAVSIFCPSCSSDNDIFNDEVKNGDQTRSDQISDTDWTTINTTYEEWAQIAPIPAIMFPEEKAIYSKVDAFCSALTDKLGQQFGKDGFAAAPLSIVTQLAIIADSSDEALKREILDAIGLEDIDELKYICGSILQYYSRWIVGAKYVNNHIWMSDLCTPGKEYVERMALDFNVGVEKVDFSDVLTTDLINDWMIKFSEGGIENYVSSSRFDGVDAIMANAACINVNIPRSTSQYTIEPGTFYLPDGTTKTVDMIKNFNYRYGFYAENEDVEMLLFFIKNYVAFVIYMPKHDVNPEELTTLINADVRMELLANPKWMLRKVNLPVFDCVSNIDASETLKALGIKSLANADLTTAGIPTKGIDVTHKGRLTFSGTQEDEGYRDWEYTEPEITVNRPFMFMVSEVTFFRSPFMSGIVVDPTVQ